MTNRVFSDHLQRKNRKFCKLQKKLQNTPYIWTKATSHETTILWKSKNIYIFIHWGTQKHNFNGWKKLQVWGVTALLRVYNMDLQFTEHPKYYNFWKPREDGEVNFSLNTIIIYILETSPMKITKTNMINIRNLNWNERAL